MTESVKVYLLFKHCLQEKVYVPHSLSPKQSNGDLVLVQIHVAQEGELTQTETNLQVSQVMHETLFGHLMRRANSFDAG